MQYYILTLYVGGMLAPTVNMTAIPLVSNGNIGSWHVNWTDALFADEAPVTYTLLIVWILDHTLSI